MKKANIIIATLLAMTLVGCNGVSDNTASQSEDKAGNIQNFTDEKLQLSFDYDADKFSVEKINEEEDNAVYIECMVDNKADHRNYIYIRYIDMSADEYYESSKQFDSSMDDFFAEDLVYFGYDGRDSHVIGYTVGGKVSQEYVTFPYKNGAYVVEMSQLIYDESNEEMSMIVSDTISEMINTIEFPVN